VAAIEEREPLRLAACEGELERRLDRDPCEIDLHDGAAQRRHARDQLGGVIVVVGGDDEDHVSDHFP